MILKNTANRKAINEYLNSVGEDDFIDDVVIPIFNQAGYATLRINSHGPGEHGKDTIFYRMSLKGPLTEDKQINDSWSTMRKVLSTHVRITTTMKRDDGRVIHIRKSTRPELPHTKIYDAVNLSHRPGKTIKTIL